MIDRQLNYGRDKMKKLYEDAGEFRSILDLGAGYGDDLLCAKRVRPEAQFYGLECVPVLRERLAENGIESFALNIENEKMPFANGSLDLVTTNQFLEHTKEIFWIFHEVSRVLKVGGHLAIGIPNLASFHSRCLLMLGRQPTCIQTASAHVRGFTRHDLLRFLNKCFPGGYELKSFYGSNFYPFPPVIAKPLAQIFPNGAVSIFLLLKKVREYENGFTQFPVVEKLETNYYLGTGANP